MTKSIWIGLAVNHSYAYERDVLRGVVRYAEAKPHWAFISVIPEQQTLTRFAGIRPQGFIASIASRQAAKALASVRRPVVNVAVILPGLKFPRVGVDNVGVGRLAAEHFLERGLRNFGFVGPPDLLFSIERRRAFCHALEQAGHSAVCYDSPANLPFDSLARRWDLDEGFRRWLKALPRPVGLFVPGDDWGVQVAEVCRQLGLRMPEDVALLGVDDDDLACELARPRLSSVIVPAERIGYEAAALLDGLLAGKKPPTEPVFLSSTGVATRRSTEILALEDDGVVAAVRYIREYAHLPLRVSDVLREMPLGRRTLERRCRQALGRSLGDEIRRAHLERARRLLTRTDLPMKTVAKQAGFSDFRHMAVVFRQQLGMPPSAYRRQNGQWARTAANTT